jgi:hypothetical protein
LTEKERKERQSVKLFELFLDHLSLIDAVVSLNIEYSLNIELMVQIYHFWFSKPDLMLLQQNQEQSIASKLLIK